MLLHEQSPVLSSTLTNHLQLFLFCVIVIAVIFLLYLLATLYCYCNYTRPYDGCRRVYRRTKGIILKLLRYKKHDIIEKDIAYEDEAVTFSDLKTGDHIFVPGGHSRRFKIKGSVRYFHHGIYLGRMVDETVDMVTDFGAADKSRPVIRTLDDFLNGYTTNFLYRRNYKDPRGILSPEEILNCAINICYKDFPWLPYSLFNNNCEHYATFLKRMKMFSVQVEASVAKFLVDPEAEDMVLKYRHWQLYSVISRFLVYLLASPVRKIVEN